MYHWRNLVNYDLHLILSCACLRLFISRCGSGCLGSIGFSIVLLFFGSICPFGIRIHSLIYISPSYAICPVLGSSSLSHSSEIRAHAYHSLIVHSDAPIILKLTTTLL